MKSYIKKLLREGLLREYEVLDFKNIRDDDGIIQYTFNINNLRYIVSFVKSDNDSNLYTLAFGVDGQDDVAFRTGKNLNHLNTVLYTVDAIVYSVVKLKSIRKIMFEGARGNTDSNVPFIDPIRLKTYLRFLKNKYPGVKFDKDRFGHVVVDIKSIYPELFEGKETKLDKFIDLIKQISDEDPDDFRIEQNYTLDGDRLMGECDSILNSKYGEMLIGVDSSESWGEHDLNIEFFDIDEVINESFNSFDELYKFLYNKFLTNDIDSPKDVDKDGVLKMIKDSLNNFGKPILNNQEVNDNVWVLETGLIFGKVKLIKNNSDLIYGIIITENKDKTFKLEYGIDQWTGDAEDVVLDWKKPIKFSDIRQLAQYILTSL